MTMVDLEAVETLFSIKTIAFCSQNKNIFRNFGLTSSYSKN